MGIRRWLSIIAGGLALVAVLGLAYLNSLQLFASDPVSQTGNGAIDGYDPVAYFREGRAQPGDSSHTHAWNGATWRFASEENRAAFAAEPERYAPAFGGYCAFAVANGYTAKSDPEAFTIAGDRLYLNFDRATQEKWLAERDAMIENGRRNWPGVIED
jgi:YHS domain-containing protein